MNGTCLPLLVSHSLGRQMLGEKFLCSWLACRETPICFVAFWVEFIDIAYPVTQILVNACFSHVC